MKMSKRAFGVKFNFEYQWLDVLCSLGVIPVEIKYGKVNRVYIEDSIIESLIEGTHYVLCPHCGKKVACITKQHNRVCKNPEFKPVYCQFYFESHKKTPEQKRAQSEKLKERFMTSEGEITKKNIGEASKKRNADPVYKESQREKFTRFQNSLENKEVKSLQSFERWADPVFREKMKKYVDENIEKLTESACRARQHLKKQSKLHIGYKKSMLEKEIQGFISEYPYGPYSIDEADPLAKIAVEVDGCFWHGCDTCGYSGDTRIKHTDKRKTTYLKNRGWVILRFKEHEIKKDPYVGIESIRTLQARRREIHLGLIKASFLFGDLKVRAMVNKETEPQWVPMSDIVRHNTSHKQMVRVNTDLGPVIVTEDHSLFSWATKEPVKASELIPGSMIVGLPGKEFEPIKVIGIDLLPPEEHTYDVSVPESENAVLDSGILVHNTYSISGVSLDIDKSSKYQALKDEYIAEYDKLVEQNKLSIKIAVGLRQFRYGIGITSALGPLNRPGVQSRRNLISAGQGGF